MSEAEQNSPPAPTVPAPGDPAVVVVPMGQSCGLTLSVATDDVAALNLDTPGVGGILGVMRASRGR